MKKLILCVSAFCFIAIAANAQVKNTTTTINPGGFMIKGGVNLANVSVTNNGRVDDANMLTSYHLGLGVNLPLSEGLSLQPSLLYTGKGAKTEYGQPTGALYIKSTSKPHYIELPVNLVGKIPLDEYTRIYIGAGPYAAMGISGKNTWERKILGVTTTGKEDIRYSNDNPTTSREENYGYGKLKKFDYGLNAVAGLDFNKFMIGANYGYGFAKINSGYDNSGNDKGKHRVLSFSLAIKM
jgi:hypothetical protein